LGVRSDDTFDGASVGENIVKRDSKQALRRLDFLSLAHLGLKAESRCFQSRLDIKPLFRSPRAFEPFANAEASAGSSIRSRATHRGRDSAWLETAILERDTNPDLLRDIVDRDGGVLESDASQISTPDPYEGVGKGGG
jgi:hypothetical protein